jgi:hypothetical protein
MLQHGHRYGVPGSHCGRFPMPCSFRLLCICALAAASIGCNFDIFDGLESPCVRAGLDCDDGNPCTLDHCVNYLDLFGTGVSGPMCEHDPTNDEGRCELAGISGVCKGGLCGEEHLCDGVVCQDDDPCTEDSCAWNGTCAFTPVTCDDGDECTVDVCDAVTGMCDFATPAEDGTWCIVDASSSLEVGGCEAGVCLGPCDPGAEEESPCPVEFVFAGVCCPGSETCRFDCRSAL